MNLSMTNLFKLESAWLDHDGK